MRFIRPLAKKLRLNQVDKPLYTDLMIYAVYFLFFAVGLYNFSTYRFNLVESYEVLRTIFNKETWASLYLSVGTLVALSASFFSIKITRVFMAISMVVSSMWAYGLLAAFLKGSDVNFGAVITYLLVIVLGSRLMVRNTAAV